MNKIAIALLISLVSLSLWAQQPKDSIDTSVINVVKPYSPSISDAFKVKDQPGTSEVNPTKEPIEYQINSVPVASTFTPSKGKAKSVTKPKRERLYDNYVSVGFGNYTTPLLEAYMRTFPTRDAEFGVMLHHHSSQGGIKEVLLDDSFYSTNLDLYYKMSSRDMNWKVNLGADHQLVHWYGIERLEDTDPTIYFNEDFLKTIEAKQRYLNIALDGEMDYFNSVFQGGKTRVRYFSDAYKSSELRFRTQPKFEFPIVTELITLRADVDYLTGSFDKTYTGEAPFSYGYLNLGFIPNFEVLREYLRINLGVKTYFSMDLEQGESAFKFYPNIDASFQVVEEVLTVFTGVTGGLNHNTYLDMVDKNPFIAPNFYSIPTDQKFKAFGGLKGKLASNINYLFKGSFSDEHNKALFRFNTEQTDGISVDETTDAYQFGNSFGVVYDDVKTLAISGELAVDFSKELTLGATANYFTYAMTNELEAWNLPNIKMTAFADYHANQWTGEAKLFMVGATKDLYIPRILPIEEPISYENYIVSNKTYLDLNIGVSYAFTNQLSAFAKGHNLLSGKYARYYHYPVQGIQVLAGITYKFDM